MNIFKSKSKLFFHPIIVQFEKNCVSNSFRAFEGSRNIVKTSDFATKTSFETIQITATQRYNFYWVGMKNYAKF